jgi:LPS-assembly lipoprotein
MIKVIHSLILLFFMAFLLPGCGFEPMYGPKSGPKTPSSAELGTVPTELSQIEIAIIPDREGQLLRNHLIDRLYLSGYPESPIATLNVSKIIEKRTELDLTKSSDATRAQLRLTTQMTLTDQSGATLLTRSLQSVTSFNILGSEFATRVTEDAARKSALNDLARQIELNLSLYYSNK